MPIYEYQCQKCKHQFEAIRKVSDPPLTTCPQCGKESLKKLVSKAAFRLKGGGWYETDFKGGKKKNVLEGEAKSSESSSGEGTAKSAGEAPKSSDPSTSKTSKSTDPSTSKTSKSTDPSTSKTSKSTTSGSSE
jgi:putative FmdB family regulatory protein